MTDNNEIIEPWNDESNLSIEERRGTFLKVLCILSWISIGLSLFTNVVAYLGGKEKVLENISQTEDEISKLPEESGIFKLVLEMSIEWMKLTYDNFFIFHVGNILGLLIGGLAVYMMFSLKKQGFLLYILYSIVIIGVTVFVGGLSPAYGGIIVAIAFIIMYGVNTKRMTA